MLWSAAPQRDQLKKSVGTVLVTRPTIEGLRIARDSERATRRAYAV